MLKNKLLSILYLSLLAVIFYPLISGADIAWGDAPYFTGKAFTDLLIEPLAWINRGNALGNVNSLLWISPIMFLYGFLGNLGLSNNLILLLVFYIPSIFFGLLGMFLLSKLFKASNEGSIVGAFFYLINTYYILLVDGGQVGVVLAYGLLPLMVLSILRIKKNNLPEIITALLLVNLVSIADPRFAVVGYAIVILWLLVSKLIGYEVKINAKSLVFIVMVHLGLSLYWLIPFLKLGGNVASSLSEYIFTSLLHSLTLYQPHWPGNQFGKVTAPSFIFVFVPIFILLFNLKNNTKSVKVFTFLYLLFAFLAKGNNYPLEWLYSFFVNTPVGIAFRDSSKFYPAIILSVSLVVASIVTKYKKQFISYAFIVLIILMVPEAFLNKLNFVLKAKKYDESYTKVQTLILNDNTNFRTLWIPEIYPLHWSTENKPAIRGSELSNIRMFARLNAGTYDPFNYFNRTEFTEWFDIAGIKYVVVNPNHRLITPSVEELDMMKQTESLISTHSAFTKIIEEEDISVYETRKQKPKVYAVKTVIGVIGGDDIYKNLEGRIDKQGVVFFEDGLFDPRSLEGIATQSAILSFNNKSEKDLTMSFLQKYFKEINPKTWGKYAPHETQLWRYQLLIRGIDTNELEYAKGISLSTNVNETEKIVLNSKDAPSITAIRLMGSYDALAEITVNNKRIDWRPQKPGLFEWVTEGTGDKKVEISITNKSGIVVINTVALIPLNEYTKAEQMTRNFIGSFKTYTPDELSEYDSEWVSIDYYSRLHNRFALKAPVDYYWIVLGDNYHKDWKLRRDTSYFSSVPFYSSINGFYIEPSWNNTEVVFKGQEYFRWGILGSTVTILLVSLGIVWKLAK